MESTIHFQNLARKYRNDPFLPEPIRSYVAQFFRERWSAQESAHHEAAEYYVKWLSEGKGWDTLDTNSNWVHNRINDHLNESGWGVSDTKLKFNSIRLQIDEYFSAFNPIRPKKRRKGASDFSEDI